MNRQESWLITNGWINAMEEEPPEQGDVFIEAGIIKKMGQSLAKEPASHVFDASGCVVMPGFIDAHCHLGLMEDAIQFEGDDVNEATDPVTPHLRAIDGINPMDRTFEEARQGGVTCVATGPGSTNVIGGQYCVIKTWGNRVDDMILKAPAAMKCAFGENPKKTYKDQKKGPATRMEIAALLRETLFKAMEYRNEKRTAESHATKMPAFDMKLEALLPVLAKNIPLKAHVHRMDDIFTAIRIAREFDLDLTLDHCTEGHLMAEVLAEEGYPLIVGPTFGHRTKYELKNKVFETPAILRKAGNLVAITTDSPVIPLQHLNLCAALAVKAGLDPQEALKAITIYPARMLGIQHRVGSLSPGKEADLVIWDKDPLLLEARVLAVFINGHLVFKEPSQ